MNFVDLMCAAQAKKKIEDAKGDVNEIAKIGAGMLVVNKMFGGTMTDGFKESKKARKARDKELLRQSRQDAEDRAELVALRNSPEYENLPGWRKFILNVYLFF